MVTAALAVTMVVAIALVVTVVVTATIVAVLVTVTVLRVAEGGQDTFPAHVLRTGSSTGHVSYTCPILVLRRGLPIALSALPLL